MSTLGDLLLDLLELLASGPSTHRGTLVLLVLLGTVAAALQLYLAVTIPSPVHAKEWLFVMFLYSVLVGMSGSVYSLLSLWRDRSEPWLAAVCLVVNAVALLTPLVA